MFLFYFIFGTIWGRNHCVYNTFGNFWTLLDTSGRIWTPFGVRGDQKHINIVLGRSHNSSDVLFFLYFGLFRGVAGVQGVQKIKHMFLQFQGGLTTVPMPVTEAKMSLLFFNQHYVKQGRSAYHLSRFRDFYFSPIWNNRSRSSSSSSSRNYENRGSTGTSYRPANFSHSQNIKLLTKVLWTA